MARQPVCTNTPALFNEELWGRFFADTTEQLLFSTWRGQQSVRGKYTLRYLPFRHVDNDDPKVWRIRDSVRRIPNDTRHGIVLYFENLPVALLGFEIQDDIIFIKQIQGYPGVGDVLYPFYWEMLLVLAVFLFVQDHPSGYRAICILPAQLNETYPRSFEINNVRKIAEEKAEKMIEKRKRYHRHYDRPAEDLRFELFQTVDDYGCFHVLWLVA